MNVLLKWLMLGAGIGTVWLAAAVILGPLFGRFIHGDSDD